MESAPIVLLLTKRKERKMYNYDKEYHALLEDMCANQPHILSGPEIDEWNAILAERNRMRRIMPEFEPFPCHDPLEE